MLQFLQDYLSQLLEEHWLDIWAVFREAIVDVVMWCALDKQEVELR